MDCRPFTQGSIGRRIRAATANDVGSITWKSERDRAMAPPLCTASSRSVLAVVTVCATAIAPIRPAAAADPTWQPARNVEIIAPAASGSALDSVARLLQRVIQDQRLVASSMTVVNKAGGGNAVGFAYLAAHAGDGHYLLVTPFTIITNRITGSNPLSYQDFTPLAMLADEHIGFVVNAKSSIGTGRDLLERLKKDPESVSMALDRAAGAGADLARAGGRRRLQQLARADRAARNERRPDRLLGSGCRQGGCARGVGAGAREELADARV